LKRLYKLLLPLSIVTTATVTTQAATKSVKHTIKSGETLYTIAHRNHTTIEAVRKVNGIKKGETLKVGRVLVVPKDTYNSKTKKKVVKVSKKSKQIKVAKNTKKSKISKSSKHVIKSGDSLFAIALKHHTTVEKLRKANGMKKGETLKLGKVINIPGSKGIKSTKSVKKKKIKMAKTKTNRSERKLANTLKSVKFKKMAKASSTKSHKFSISDILFSSSGKGKSTNITRLAKKKLGRRYVWGATGKKNTFDCSGFTTYVCKKNGIKLPRRAIEQSKYGKYVSRSELKPGDLIFFDTSKRHKGYVNHVGIYLGNNKFIHASSAKKKVVITSLNKNFYSKRYKGARRVSS
jgi:cell wall-associated NlpC family hydrolase